MHFGRAPRILRAPPMSQPLVSIVIPTYNRRALLETAIDSVLAQTLDDFEVLIVDDASTDDTGAALARWADADARIRVQRMTVNRGCDAARNTAMRIARGRYLVFLDDDDLFLPQRLELTVNRLEAEPGLDAVCSHFGCIDAAGTLRPWTPAFIAVGEDATPGEDVFELLYCDWGWIPTCTLTLRAERRGTLEFLELRRNDNDALFNAQLAASGLRFAQLPRSLALVRRDPSHTSMSRDRGALVADRRQSLVLLRRWLAEQGITKFDQLHARAWSNHLLKEAEVIGGLGGLLQVARALCHYPLNGNAARYLRRLILPRR